MPNTLAGVEQFTSLGSATVTAGGTTAPLAGTQESWTLASSSLPAASSASVTGFYAVDPLQPSEIVLVTDISGSTATVIRGADSTTPVAHSSPFTVVNVAAGATLRALQAPGLNVATQFGADTTGTNASDSAFNAAVTATPLQGGLIVVPPGTYKISSGVPVSRGSGAGPVVFWLLPGAVVNYYGSGSCFSFHTTAANPTGRRSGIIGQGVIDGTNAAAGAAGAEFGDIVSHQLCATIQNFSGAGSMGVKYHNLTTWCEEGEALVYLVNNTTAVDFSGVPAGSSYDYSRFDFRIYANAGQNGVVLNNVSLFGTAELSIRGNFQTSSSPFTAYVLTLTSASFDGQLNINVETDGGLANTHALISHDTPSYLRATGRIMGISFTAASSVAGGGFGPACYISGEAALENAAWGSITSGFPAGFSGTVKFRKTPTNDAVILQFSLTIAASTVITQGENLFTLPSGFFDTVIGAGVIAQYNPNGASPTNASISVLTSGQVHWSSVGLTTPAGGNSFLVGSVTYGLQV